MQNPSPDTAPPERSPVTDALRVQILATEHWSLLAGRSLIWNETFSRASMFLTTLSAAVVALALVAQATDFGDDFSTFALLVLPLVLVLGVWTSVRLGVAQNEDVWLVAGTNRLRHAYLDLAPDLEHYFVTSRYDDAAGVMQSYNPTNPSPVTRILTSTPGLLGAVNAALVGVIVALIVEFFGQPPAVHGPAGGIAALATGVLLVGVLPHRQMTRFDRNMESRFPR